MGTSIENLYDLIAGDEDARVCRDISEEACTAVPANFFLQLGAQAATKLGDALSDPKLVLTWLLHTLGAPTAAVGLLVPVREAGSLLPQLAIGGAIRKYPIRKWWWVAGSLAQGLAVLAIGGIAVLWPVPAAAWGVLALMGLFSVARAVCSVSSKDLVGKTVPKTRRGRLSGLAATAAGLITLLVGFFSVARNGGEIGPGRIALFLFFAAGLWFLAAGLMARLREDAGATSGGGSALVEALASLRLLVEDRTFLRFCIARALLAGTILSMPFYVILAQDATGGRLAGLGILLVASSGAQALSATTWGWMADRSSSGTLAVAGTAAGAVGVLTWLVAGFALPEAVALWVYGGLFFLIGLAHTGIRVGRKTYLVDMAPADRRASYVAVSNTLIGVVLLAGGSIGLLAPILGTRGVVLAFAVLGLAGGGLAWRLRHAGD
jgi:hypothetical protein